LTLLKFSTPKETEKIKAEDVKVSFGDTSRAGRILFDLLLKYIHVYGAYAHDVMAVMLVFQNVQ